MPATVAGPRQSFDSEQISPATITHSTQFTNRHQTFSKAMSVNGEHSCTWWVSYLSRGQISFEPSLSKHALPLTKATTVPNSAISSTQTFDRILFYVWNSRYFDVQEAKNGDWGTIVFTTALTGPLFPIGIENLAYLIFVCHGSSNEY